MSLDLIFNTFFVM